MTPSEGHSRLQGCTACAGPNRDHVAGVRHDPMLYSYLLDPTYSSHALAEVALRRFNLKLAGTGRIGGHRRPADRSLRNEVEQAGLSKLYEEIDLPLVSVLTRMEQAGVKIDTAALSKMSSNSSGKSVRKRKKFTKLRA